MKTLKTACEEFVEHLRATGTKDITAKAYGRILAMFAAFVGGERDVSTIASADLTGFYASEPANMKTMKDGRKLDRAGLSILQIRRDVRLALCWFKKQGWIEKLPLPDDETAFFEPGTCKEETVPGKDEPEPVEEPKPRKRSHKLKSKPADSMDAAGLGNTTIQEPDQPEPAVTAEAEPRIGKDIADTTDDGGLVL